jgi:hypothetical protein
MCSTVLLKAAPGLREVHLYSSGNNAVLRSWSAEDGIPALANVSGLNILWIWHAGLITAVMHLAKKNLYNGTFSS